MDRPLSFGFPSVRLAVRSLWFSNSSGQTLAREPPCTPKLLVQQAARSISCYLQFQLHNATASEWPQQGGQVVLRRKGSIGRWLTELLISPTGGCCPGAALCRARSPGRHRAAERPEPSIACTMRRRSAGLGATARQRFRDWYKRCLEHLTGRTSDPPQRTTVLMTFRASAHGPVSACCGRQSFGNIHTGRPERLVRNSVPVIAFERSQILADLRSRRCGDSSPALTLFQTSAGVCPLGERLVR